MPSDDSMIGPGAHGQVAHSQAMDGDTASAMADFLAADEVVAQLRRRRHASAA
jgi:hypothetical protein